jgi:hypothetical protein
MACGGVAAGVYFLVVKPVREVVRNGRERAEPQRPVPPKGSVDEALAWLRTTDAKSVKDGLTYLGMTDPDPARRDEVAAALHREWQANAQLISDPHLTDWYLAAVERWGTAANVPDLASLIPSPGLVRPVDSKWQKPARVLHKIDPALAADKVAGLAFGRATDLDARQLLREFGPDGYRAALRKVNDPDEWVRVGAEQVSGELAPSKAALARDLFRQSVADLSSVAPGVIGRAAGRLAKPDAGLGIEEADAATAAPALLAAADRTRASSGSVPSEIAHALVAWARGEHAPELARLLKLKLDGPSQLTLIRKLTEFKDPRTFPTLIDLLGDPAGVSLWARQALTAVGPAAELALRQAADDHPDPKVREQCRQMLATAALPAGRPVAPPVIRAQDPGLRSLLTELASVADDRKGAAALLKLADLDPGKYAADDRDAVVAATEAAVSADRPERLRAGVRVLDRWAAERHADHLARVILKQPAADVSLLVKKLGGWKAKSAVRAIVSAAEGPANADAAVEAVTAIGPGAESDVLRQLAPVRTTEGKQVALCRMLETVGTKRSVNRLEAFRKYLAARKTLPEADKAAEKALKAIRAREGM